jgi:hypothetical protein
MSKKPFGWIYRIFHKEMPNLCYIGQTQVGLEKRFKGHVNAAKKTDKANDSDAKLHHIMWAHKPETFQREVIDTADNQNELDKKEKDYQQVFDSIDNGWNKVKAKKTTLEKGKPIKTTIDGVTYKAGSLAALCRDLDISYSTVLHYQKKEKTLNFSIKKALHAKEQTNKKGSITVFRKTFQDVNKLAKSKSNKYKLHPSTIRQRVKKGKTYEEALLEKPTKPKPTIINIKNKTRQFKSITEAHRILSKEIKGIPAYSSIIAAVGKGATLEEAFKIDKPKWQKSFSDIDKLIEEGYQLEGELNAQSKPVVDHKKKEIFASIKIFSRSYGFDYTTIAAEIKSGLSPEEIINKRE